MARRGRRTQVVVPSKPATVASIDVHGDVGQVQRLEGICDTIAVTGGRVNAGLEVDVGDQVGETVGFDDQSNGNVGVLLEDGNNSCAIIRMFHVTTHSIHTVNVLRLVPGNAANGELSVGGLSGAVTAGKIVNDESGDRVARNVLDRVLDDIDLGDGVTESISLMTS
jgi:hypothetical protein